MYDIKYVTSCNNVQYFSTIIRYTLCLTIVPNLYHKMRCSAENNNNNRSNNVVYYCYYYYKCSQPYTMYIRIDANSRVVVSFKIYPTLNSFSSTGFGRRRRCTTWRAFDSDYNTRGTQSDDSRYRIPSSSESM